MASPETKRKIMKLKEEIEDLRHSVCSESHFETKLKLSDILQGKRNELRELEGPPVEADPTGQIKLL